ncbi:MAG: glycosyltransferase [Actinomycetota bacterium]
MIESSSDRPLISVVIPTYQRAPLLERSLESLTEQTLPRSQFEVVVIDDGSSDWTETICNRIAEEIQLRRLRIVNSGISAAKNLGLFVSRAPLVLFFDDDDTADPGLLEAHVEAHRAHPEENVAVLGYTTWAHELEVTPLMEYVTEIGQLLFAYHTVEDGDMRDHTYFWGGRSSAKRSFLAQHGSFHQDFPAIIEDIELGFRLAKHGLKVFHTRSARSYMLRAPAFDEFARRCVKRGRGLWLFNARHGEDPEVRRYCRVEEAIAKWPNLAPALDAKMALVRELEGRHSDAGELEESELAELRELYGWIFEALQAKGIAEAAAEAKEAREPSRAEPARLPEICPEPVFIIGAPRSGSSILAWSLAQHSELWTHTKSDVFFYMLEYPNLERAFETSLERPDSGWLGNHGITVDQFLAHIGMGLNALVTSAAGGRRWVDQTPANTYVVERLGRLFPQARFIHLLRDGRRVVHSMINFQRVLGDAENVEKWRSSGRLPSWAADFREACQTWAGLTHLASEFCCENPERTFTVTNERLITDSDGAMHDLLEFLSLRQEPGPAELLRTQRINSSFVGTGRAELAPPALSEPWLEWLPEQRHLFMEEAGELMVSCGFATEAELVAWADASGGVTASGGGQANGDGRTPSEIPLDELGSRADVPRPGD